MARIRGSKAVRANAEGRSGLRLGFSPLAGIRGLQLHIEEHGVPPTYREFQSPGGDSRVATTAEMERAEGRACASFSPLAGIRGLQLRMIVNPEPAIDELQDGLAVWPLNGAIFSYEKI